MLITAFTNARYLTLSEPDWS